MSKYYNATVKNIYIYNAKNNMQFKNYMRTHGKIINWF